MECRQGAGKMGNPTITRVIIRTLYRVVRVLHGQNVPVPSPKPVEQVLSNLILCSASLSGLKPPQAGCSLFF